MSAHYRFAFDQSGQARFSSYARNLIDRWPQAPVLNIRTCARGADMTYAPVPPTLRVPPTRIAKDTFVIHQVQEALGQPLFIYLNSFSPECSVSIGQSFATRALDCHRMGESRPHRLGVMFHPGSVRALSFVSWRSDQGLCA